MAPATLVVVDDPGIRHVLVVLLVTEGSAVEQAIDGLMAVWPIARQEPDLILSDVWRPRLDGIGLATTLSSHTPPIPIILKSANPLPYGCAQPFIRASFALETLLSLIARALPVTVVAAVALNRPGAVSG